MESAHFLELAHMTPHLLIDINYQRKHVFSLPVLRKPDSRPACISVHPIIHYISLNHIVYIALYLCKTAFNYCK